MSGTTTLPDSKWRKRAACKGLATELFYPERGDSAGIQAARDVCATCSVVPECLATSLVSGEVAERFGIYGGMTAIGRSRFRKAVSDDPKYAHLAIPAGDHPSVPPGDPVDVKPSVEHDERRERAIDALTRSGAPGKRPPT